MDEDVSMSCGSIPVQALGGSSYAITASVNRGKPPSLDLP